MAKKSPRRRSQGPDRSRSRSQVRKKQGANIPNRVPAHSGAESVPVAEAARILGVSVTTLKRMRKDGQLRWFPTHGGHVRIPRAELERIQAGDDEQISTSPNPLSDSVKTRRQNIENITLEAQEIRARQELRKVKEEAAELDEKREARKRDLENQRARVLEESREHAELEEARHEAEAERARVEQGRREWIAAWQNWALKQIPTDAREFGLDVHQSVEEALLRLGSAETREMVEQLVRSAMEKALKPYRRQKEIDQALQLARKELPALLQRYFEPGEWELKAIARAREAIRILPSGADLAEVQQAAIRAGREVALEYEREQSQSQPAAKSEWERRERESKKDFLVELGVSEARNYLSELHARDELWSFDWERRSELESCVRAELRRRIVGSESHDVVKQIARGVVGNELN